MLRKEELELGNVFSFAGDWDGLFMLTEKTVCISKSFERDGWSCIFDCLTEDYKMKVRIKKDLSCWLYEEYPQGPAKPTYPADITFVQ